MNTPPRDPEIPDLVSAAEAAEIIGVARQTIVLRAVGGSLRGAKVGGTWVFRRAVVEAEAPKPKA